MKKFNWIFCIPALCIALSGTAFASGKNKSDLPGKTIGIGIGVDGLDAAAGVNGSDYPGIDFKGTGNSCCAEPKLHTKTGHIGGEIGYGL